MCLKLIYRKYRHQSSDFKRMVQLWNDKKLVLTPNGTYDDLVMLKIAATKDGVIVSNDQYRDIFNAHTTSEGKCDLFHLRISYFLVLIFHSIL